MYLLVYADDILLTGNNLMTLNKFIANLSTRFELKDRGSLSYFVGVEVLFHPQGLFLSQKQFINDLLCKANMEECKPVAIPMVTDPPLIINGTYLQNASEYRAMIGSLQYLSLTRPDISF